MNVQKLRILVSLGDSAKDPLSKLDDHAESMSLAHAYKRFFEINPKYKLVLSSASAADMMHASVVRDLYKFLVANDLDADVYLGKHYKGSLRDPSPRIEDAVKKVGEEAVKKSIQHAVIKVNQLVVDPCFKRLGPGYSTIDNFPFREFTPHFGNALNIKHLVGMTPEKMLDILRNAEAIVGAASLSTVNSRRTLKRNRGRSRPLLRIA